MIRKKLKEHRREQRKLERHSPNRKELKRMDADSDLSYDDIVDASPTYNPKRD